ncbi:MAG: hypothetical protein IKM24_10755, partial [Clostridia bacterium]|nr:hypothetical protein [Clostridia bacterium]
MYNITDVTCCGFDADTVFIGTKSGLLYEKDCNFVTFEAVQGKVNALFAADGTLWCAAGESV